MCGRFSNALELDEYRQAVADQLPDGYQPELGPDAEQYNRSFNVAPQTRALVLRAAAATTTSTSDGGEQAESGESHPLPLRLVLQSMKWGLLPRSTKTIPKGADAYKTINARDDTILSGSGLWAPLFKKSSHRCIVFIQGFYEWAKRGGTESKPAERIAHFVGMSEVGKGRVQSVEGREYRLMPVAGLWERVRLEGESEDLYTFTIITTESNEQLRFLHDRMPVILPDAASIALWLGLDEGGGGSGPTANSASSKAVKQEESSELDSLSQEQQSGKTGSSSTSNLSQVAKLLKPFDKGQLQCFRVPPEVGKVGNNEAKFILPISDRKDGIMAAFGRAKAKAKDDAEGVKKEESGSARDVNFESHAPLPPTTDSKHGAAGDSTTRTSTERKAETTSVSAPISPSPPPKRVKAENGSSPGGFKSKRGAHPSPGGAGKSAKDRDKAKGNTEAKGNNRDIRSFFS